MLSWVQFSLSLYHELWPCLVFCKGCLHPPVFFVSANQHLVNTLSFWESFAYTYRLFSPPAAHSVPPEGEEEPRPFFNLARTQGSAFLQLLGFELMVTKLPCLSGSWHQEASRLNSSGEPGVLGHTCVFAGRCVLERHKARPVRGSLCSCAISATASFQENGGGSEETKAKGRTPRTAGSNLIFFASCLDHK